MEKASDEAFTSPFTLPSEAGGTATAQVKPPPPLLAIQGFKTCHEKEFFKHQPARLTPKQAAAYLKGKKYFAIITGAGISAASGIPTFRGDNGFWTRSYGGVTDPMKVMTEKFFRENPHLVWQWHYDFLELVGNCRPNESHYALNRFLEHCKTQGKDCALITQNIDDFDAELIRKSKVLMPAVKPKTEGSVDFAFTDHVIEMHGNIYYMHCANYTGECWNKFYRSPTLEQVADRQNHVPLCRECGGVMRPHCMFFDECYSEQLYKQQTTRDLELDMDVLIVVGTALATAGAKGMVERALEKQKIPVIEVNTEPLINEGWAISVPGKSEAVLKEMFEEYYRLEAASGVKNATKK